MRLPNTAATTFACGPCARMSGAPLQAKCKVLRLVPSCPSKLGRIPHAMSWAVVLNRPRTDPPHPHRPALPLTSPVTLACQGHVGSLGLIFHLSKTELVGASNGGAGPSEAGLGAGKGCSPLTPLGRHPNELLATPWQRDVEAAIRSRFSFLRAENLMLDGTA